jgi:hypothetical protein
VLPQIEWVESFANNAAALLPASRFLSVWRAHAALRAELQHAAAPRATAEVLPDLQLRGAVAVTAGDAVLGVGVPPGAPPGAGGSPPGHSLVPVHGRHAAGVGRGRDARRLRRRGVRTGNCVRGGHDDGGRGGRAGLLRGRSVRPPRGIRRS